MSSALLPRSSSGERPGVSRAVLGWLDRWLSRFEAALLGVGVLLMATNVVANVIGRFVFQHSFFFTEELNRVLIVLITFAGLGYATRQGRHIRMNALFEALPATWRRWLMVVIALSTAALMAALCVFSLRYIFSIAATGRLLPALQIPVYWIYLWVPVGFAVTSLEYLLTASKNITSKQVYLSSWVRESDQEEQA